MFAALFFQQRVRKQEIALSCSLLFFLATLTPNIRAASSSQEPAQSQSVPEPQYTPQTPDQLQQLVAPIALYPDSLVAQILAASTFPEQVVEADRWVQSHPDLKGDDLARAVDPMDWDPSVKALTAFPAVLGNMDKNLSWTSTLGDAYYNQQQDVMDAVQVMRQKAEAAGTLKTTPQQTVTNQDSTIVVEPASPTVVYVPAYDPWLVYGPPIVAWPGWYPYPGIWYGGPYLSFGVGFGVGFFAGFGWGWPHWGFDWHNRVVVYNHARYFSHSRTFYNRDVYYRGGRVPGHNVPHGYPGARAGVFNRPGASPRPFEGNSRAARGFAEPHTQGAQPRPPTGLHSGAFSGYDHGGESRSYSARGSSSFGGFHGEGGGHPGGGGHAGGGHH